jgi:hypothetical protein
VDKAELARDVRGRLGLGWTAKRVDLQLPECDPDGTH